MPDEIKELKAEVQKLTKAIKDLTEQQKSAEIKTIETYIGQICVSLQDLQSKLQLLTDKKQGPGVAIYQYFKGGSLDEKQ